MSVGGTIGESYPGGHAGGVPGARDYTAAHRWARAYLLVNALGVAAVSLAYGAGARALLPPVTDVAVVSAGQPAILSVIIALHLAMAAYWAIAAFRPVLHASAVAWTVIVMGGLALAHLIGARFDGVPGDVRLAFLAIEIASALAGIMVLRVMPLEQPRVRAG